MSEDCLFCQIVAGDVPSRTVYEDEATFAFLDVNPLAKGHTLVIPKDHSETVEDLPVDAAAALFEAVHTVTPAVEDAGGTEASTIAINNGEDAGQEVPHVHFHVVPRRPEDGSKPIHSLFDERPDVPDDEMDAVAESIADGL